MAKHLKKAAGGHLSKTSDHHLARCIEDPCQIVITFEDSSPTFHDSRDYYDAQASFGGTGLCVRSCGAGFDIYALAAGTHTIKFRVLNGVLRHSLGMLINGVDVGLCLTDWTADLGEHEETGTFTVAAGDVVTLLFYRFGTGGLTTAPACADMVPWYSDEISSAYITGYRSPGLHPECTDCSDIPACTPGTCSDNTVCGDVITATVSGTGTDMDGSFALTWDGGMWSNGWDSYPEFSLSCNVGHWMFGGVTFNGGMGPPTSVGFSLATPSSCPPMGVSLPLIGGGSVVFS